jgi:hypothetical protein
MTAVLIIEAVAILLLAILVVGLLRSHAEILRALHDLGVRQDGEGARRSVGLSPRPRTTLEGPSDISGSTPSGSTRHIGVTGIQTRTLLAFLSTGCSSCIPLWEGLRSDSSLHELPDTRLVVVTKGPEAESPSRLSQLAPDESTVIQSTDAWDSYGVPVTPYFVLVDGPTGEIVGEGSASSWEQVNSLIVQAASDREATEVGEELRADRELKRAGIGPDHPSLYPGRPPTTDDA